MYVSIFAYFFLGLDRLLLSWKRFCTRPCTNEVAQNVLYSRPKVDLTY